MKRKEKMRFGKACLDTYGNLYCTMMAGHKGPHVATKCGMFPGRPRASASVRRKQVRIAGDVLAVWSIPP